MINTPLKYPHSAANHSNPLFNLEYIWYSYTYNQETSKPQMKQDTIINQQGEMWCISNMRHLLMFSP